MGSQRVGHDWATELNWTVGYKTLKVCFLGLPWWIAYILLWNLTWLQYIMNIFLCHISFWLPTSVFCPPLKSSSQIPAWSKSTICWEVSYRPNTGLLPRSEKSWKHQNSQTTDFLPQANVEVGPILQNLCYQAKCEAGTPWILGQVGLLLPSHQIFLAATEFLHLIPSRDRLVKGGCVTRGLTSPVPKTEITKTPSYFLFWNTGLSGNFWFPTIVFKAETMQAPESVGGHSSAPWNWGSRQRNLGHNREGGVTGTQESASDDFK